MATLHGSTVVARPVEEVFDFVADERNEPRYNPRMVRAAMLTPGPIADGTRWSATVESRGRPLDLEIEVTDCVRPHRLASTTRMAAAEIRGAVTFEPDVAGTRIRWSWEVRTRGLLRLAAPLIVWMGRRQEAETWAGLKRYLESREPPTSGS